MLLQTSSDVEQNIGSPALVVITELDIGLRCSSGVMSCAKFAFDEADVLQLVVLAQLETNDIHTREGLITGDSEPELLHRDCISLEANQAFNRKNFTESTPSRSW